MVGEGGLPHIQALDQLAGTFFPALQELNNLQSVFIAEGP